MKLERVCACCCSANQRRPGAFCAHVRCGRSALEDSQDCSSWNGVVLRFVQVINAASFYLCVLSEEKIRFC